MKVHALSPGFGAEIADIDLSQELDDRTFAAIEKIYNDTKRIIEEPDFRQKQLVDKGYEVVGSGPAEFAAYIRKDRESRGRAVKISGAKAE